MSPTTPTSVRVSLVAVRLQAAGAALFTLLALGYAALAYVNDQRHHGDAPFAGLGEFIGLYLGAIGGVFTLAIAVGVHRLRRGSSTARRALIALDVGFTIALVRAVDVVRAGIVGQVLWVGLLAIVVSAAVSLAWPSTKEWIASHQEPRHRRSANR